MPPRPYALTFPGQGSQRPGAGLPWQGTPAWTVVEQAGEAAGDDLGRLLLSADAEELRTPWAAQVSTLLVSLLALHAWRAAVGAAPVAVAGHSLGELSALEAAAAFAEPVVGVTRLVLERGAAMDAAARTAPGTMAAVLGLEADGVAHACAQARAEGSSAWPANDNAPAHVVVSGTADGVARAGEIARAAGARRVLSIPVGGAFHTPLMEPAAQRLGAALDATVWAVPSGRFVSAVDARGHTDSFAALLSGQLTAPVRWRETVDALVRHGAQALVELGPGGVLTGLARRCAPTVTAVSVSTPEDVEAAVAALEEVR